MQTLMKLEGITKVYGEGDLAVEALRGVNLEVGVGDYLAVMGIIQGKEHVRKNFYLSLQRDKQRASR